MSTIFVTSDTHFGHGAMLGFISSYTGRRMRSFMSTGDMDDYIVQEWNKVVRPHDKVYHLGDVAMEKKHIATIGRCHGKKRLVRGNHDIFPTKCYLPFFEDIYGIRVLDGLALTHIPLHPSCVKPAWTNVHGHVHNNVAPDFFGPHYLNVSVEVTGYRPLALEEVRAMVVQRREAA